MTTALTDSHTPSHTPSPTTIPVHQRTRATLTEQAINPTGTSDEQKSEEIPVPEDQAGIDKLRIEIDAVDAELVRLIQHRTAISHAIGLARRKIGGPRIVYSREMAILERFRVLGPAGTDLGMLLLAMGRGKLGRK